MSFSLKVTPPPTFTLKAAPAAITIAAGSSFTSGNILATGLYGFTAHVALTTSTPPTGVTVHFGSNTIAGSDGSTSLSIATTSAVTPGTYALTVTGTSTGISPSPTAVITLTVTPFTFNFTETASTLTMAQGTASSAVALAIAGPANSFTSSIALAATGLPGGVTAAFSPASISAPASGAAVASVTFHATGTATTGTFPVALTATANGVTKTLNFSLRVTPPATFTLRTAPPAVTLTAGSSYTSGSILSTGLYGFTGNVGADHQHTSERCDSTLRKQ